MASSIQIYTYIYIFQYIYIYIHGTQLQLARPKQQTQLQPATDCIANSRMASTQYFLAILCQDELWEMLGNSLVKDANNLWSTSKTWHNCCISRGRCYLTNSAAYRRHKLAMHILRSQQEMDDDIISTPSSHPSVNSHSSNVYRMSSSSLSSSSV